MYKKNLASLVTLATTASLVLSPHITVLADDVPEAITEQTTISSGQHTYSEVIVEITNDSADTSGLVVTGNGTQVTIEGNVDASGVKVTTGNNGNTIYDAACGIRITDSASVSVEGSVTGAEDGAYVRDDATLNVSGNVQASGADHTVYLWNEGTNAYDIPVNTVNGTAISTDGDSTINVSGNANGVTDGLLINPDNDNQKGSITVLGTITASSMTGPGIQVYTPSAQHGGINYTNADDFLNDVPTITVYAINAPVPLHANAYDSEGSSIQSTVFDKIEEAINFIIKEDASNAQYGISVTGANLHSTTIDGNDYKTVNINKAFEVAASDLPDGYTISGGTNVNVTDNGNGTYTLTLTNLKGGITIKAVLRPTPASDSSDEDNSSYDVIVQEVTPTYSDPAQAPAGAIVVSNNAGSSNAAVAAISGEKPARTVSYNMSSITPMQYKTSIIQNVASAPSNGALNIETDRVACFDSRMIEAFMSRSDIDVNVVFNYNGKKLKVTIPAGYDVRKLLDTNGYCGFLRLLTLLGGTEL